MRKYNSPLTKSQSWQDIESWYSELINHGLNFEPLLDLVKHIRKTNLTKKLYAFTSVHKLIISIYPEFEWNREALHIEFDINTRKWFFYYHPKPFEPIEFERTYSENLGINKFDQFVKFINW